MEEMDSRGPRKNQCLTSYASATSNVVTCSLCSRLSLCLCSLTLLPTYYTLFNKFNNLLFTESSHLIHTQYQQLQCVIDMQGGKNHVSRFEKKSTKLSILSANSSSPSPSSSESESGLGSPGCTSPEADWSRAEPFRIPGVRSPVKPGKA